MVSRQEMHRSILGKLTKGNWKILWFTKVKRAESADNIHIQLVLLLC